jgi:stearoyl-CoA desaturase (delta-9 desaturase)
MITAIIFTLVATHISVVLCSVYVHRGIAHKNLKFHPILSHAIRTWLWLTESIIVKDWASTHQQHHAYADSARDPHLDVQQGVWRVSWLNFWQHLTSKFSHRARVRYGNFPGFDEDWADRNIYNRHYLLGLFLMLLIDILLFQWVGIMVWAVQMIWSPLWISAVANGLGHYCGYRNYKTPDNSRNLWPVGIFIGGDEMHNNHHADPSIFKTSRKWWEFDIGWMYVTLFKRIGWIVVL